MFNPKSKANQASMRSFKCLKYVCGFEQFTTPDIWFRVIKYIHSKKKKMHKSKHVLISIEKNFSSSVQDELQPITRVVLSGKVRMQDSITAIAWKPVFKVFLRIWRQSLQHFSYDEKYIAKYRVPFRNSEILLSRCSTYGEAGMQVCWKISAELVYWSQSSFA